MDKKSKERGYEMRKGQLIDYLFSGMTISMRLFCQLFMMLIFTMKRSVDLKKGGGGGVIKLQVDQLQAVKDYNKNMNRVDPSDQSTGKYDTLRKTNGGEPNKS